MKCTRASVKYLDSPANLRFAMVGVVLNNADLRKDGYENYYYYRHYSGYGQESSKNQNVGASSQ